MNAVVRILLAALLFGALAPAVVAQSPRGEGRGDLREALRDYYLHLIDERLELDGAAKEQLRPLVGEMMAAQTQAQRERRRVLEALSRLDDGPAGDEAAERLLRRLAEVERRGATATGASRQRVLDALDGRRQATFLLVEDGFRQAVRRHLADLRRGASAERGARPWTRREGAAERGSRARPEQLGRGEDAQPPAARQRRLESLRDDLTTLLVLQVRRSLGLEPARLVELLPALEALVSSELEWRRHERLAKWQLRQALQGEATDEELRGEVRELQAEQRRLADAQRAARDLVLSDLAPREAAQFAVLHERFQREGPRRLGQLGREPERPRPDGPWRRR